MQCQSNAQNIKFAHRPSYLYLLYNFQDVTSSDTIHSMLAATEIQHTIYVHNYKQYQLLKQLHNNLAWLRLHIVHIRKRYPSGHLGEPKQAPDHSIQVLDYTFEDRVPNIRCVSVTHKRCNSIHYALELHLFSTDPLIDRHPIHTRDVMT